MSALSAEFRNAHRISPSQIETARLCLRKWGLNKLDKLPLKSNKYAERGNDTHHVLEGWSKDSKIDLTTDAGKIASAGLKFLPKPGTHKIEHNFVFDSGNAVYHGRMDLRGQIASPIQVIWDHKTTSSFIWIKRPEILRADPQANIYAKAALEEGRKIGINVERVEQNWVYYLADPKKPKSRKVQLHVLPSDKTRIPVRNVKEVKPEHFGIMYFSELEDRFGEIEETAQQLLHLYHDKPKAMELPYNASACSAYGGCPYAGEPCKLTMSERIQSMQQQETLAEKMKRSLGSAETTGTSTPVNQAAATAVAATPTTAEVKAPPAASVAKQPSFSERMAAGDNGAATAPAASTPAAAATTPSDQPSVNPPEQKKGVDPDAPKTQTREGGTVVSSFGRTEIAAMAMQGLIAAREFSTDNNRYPVQVAAEAVQCADALLAALAK